MYRGEQLEIKKSHKADLENKRVTYFLLGLNLVLALLYVGLEFRFVPIRFDLTNELLDDIVEEIEMEPVKDEREDMISAAPAPVAPSITTHVKPIEATETKVENILENNAPEAEGMNEASEKAKEIPANTETVPMTEEEKLKDILLVQTLPEFPGGIVEFMKWLQKNLKYPKDAQSRKVEGTVVVSFIINTDGSITDTKVDKGVEDSLDYEAMRVIRKMPKWKPGQENGKPCRTMFAIPIVFKL